MCYVFEFYVSLYEENQNTAHLILRTKKASDYF